VVIHDVFSAQKLWRESLKQKEISKLNALLRPVFEKIIIKLKCLALHTVSESTKDDLMKFSAKKPIYVIHNAIPVDTKENVETNPPFISISRLTFYKNVQVVIKSMNILKKSFSNIVLVIVGDGPHRKNLENPSPLRNYVHDY